MGILSWRVRSPSLIGKPSLFLQMAANTRRAISVTLS